MVQPCYEIQQAAIIRSSTGSKKLPSSFVELSKCQLFIAIHAIVIGLIMVYQVIWMLSPTTIAYCYPFRGDGVHEIIMEPGTIIYQYSVEGQSFSDYTTRNEAPLTQKTMRIRYLSFIPSLSRPDSFEGNWLGFFIGWGIFFVISSMIFFIPNPTMPKRSFFYFTRHKPWVHMIIK